MGLARTVPDRRASGLYLHVHPPQARRQPEFLALQRAGQTSRAPLREVWQWKRAIALVFFIITLHSSIFYLVLTFASTYMAKIAQVRQRHHFALRVRRQLLGGFRDAVWRGLYR